MCADRGIATSAFRSATQIRKWIRFPFVVHGFPFSRLSLSRFSLSPPLSLSFLSFSFLSLFFFPLSFSSLSLFHSSSLSHNAGKYSSTHANGARWLQQGFGRGVVNLQDMNDLASFSGQSLRWGSIDCRPLISAGAATSTSFGDHFWTISQLHATPHALWAVLYLVPWLTPC